MGCARYSLFRYFDPLGYAPTWMRWVWYPAAVAAGSRVPSFARAQCSPSSLSPQAFVSVR